MRWMCIRYVYVYGIYVAHNLEFMSHNYSSGCICVFIAHCAIFNLTNIRFYYHIPIATTIFNCNNNRTHSIQFMHTMDIVDRGLLQLSNRNAKLYSTHFLLLLHSQHLIAHFHSSLLSMCVTPHPSTLIASIWASLLLRLAYSVQSTHFALPLHIFFHFSTHSSSLISLLRSTYQNMHIVAPPFQFHRHQ